MSFVQDKQGVQPGVRDVLDGGSQKPQAVFAVRGTVGVGDDGSAVDIGTIPADADIVGITVDVTTAFDDSGTDLLDVGTSSDADHYRNDLDVASTGQTVTGWSNLGDVGSSDVDVQATYTGANSDGSAGSADVIVQFVPSG